MAEERLRGNPDAIQWRIPDKARVKTYGTRKDGTPKGAGFFGELANQDEPEFFSTELSAAIPMPDGTKITAPLLVPTLTAEELAHLIAGGQPTLTIVQKAQAHAMARKKAGKSVYAEEGERVPIPTSSQMQMEEGFSQI